MLSLLKFIDGPWEKAKGYLRADLDHIEAAFNQRWASTFGDSNKLQASTIDGDSTQATRYVANTGTDNAPEWDQVNLSNGVKSTLPLAKLDPATLPAVIIGRESGSTGAFEQLTLGPGVQINGTVISVNPSSIIGQIPVGRNGKDGKNANPIIIGGAATASIAFPTIALRTILGI